jgi:thymidylate synthase (FAD)
MKLINAKFEILEPTGKLFKDIELAARTCYKSEDKITDDSAEKMLKNLIDRKHTAMLEHGTIYLKVKWYDLLKIGKYFLNKYSKVKWNYITTNYRVIIENNWEYDMQYYQYEPNKSHEKRISVRFICDRGVSHEYVRHRVFSFAQESTRYCNYSKDKFDNQLTFIIPEWSTLQPSEWTHKQVIGSKPVSYTEQEQLWLEHMSWGEKTYNKLVTDGWQPQQARAVLPNSLKTELIMTGTINQWKEFFILRDAPTAHPQARELAQPLHVEFKKRNLI